MISIAVLVFDKDYAAGLEKYLSAGTWGDFLFGVYSNPEGFDRFVKERCADVIVAEEGCLDIEPEVPCVKLIRKRNALRDEGIGMYRSLDLVAEDIRDAAARFGHDFRQKEGDALKPEDHVSEETDAGHENDPCERITDETAKRVANAGSAQITGVCSPLGGVYSSTFAFALAAYHSKGARTLFVSFDPFFDPVSKNSFKPLCANDFIIYKL